MKSKELLCLIETWAYNYTICERKDANHYFSYGYLACLRKIATDRNLDYFEAEERGQKRGDEWLKQEKAKKSFLVFD